MKVTNKQENMAYKDMESPVENFRGAAVEKLVEKGICGHSCA